MAGFSLQNKAGGTAAFPNNKSGRFIASIDHPAFSKRTLRKPNAATLVSLKGVFDPYKS